jgi:PilZ domain
MGKRVEPRLDIQVPVRVFGTDKSGSVFSQKVVTVNISRGGVELAEIEVQLAVSEIIGLTYASKRGHFRVKWVGTVGGSEEGHVGLVNIAPEKPLWDFAFPTVASDTYEAGTVERRQHPRWRCQNSVEIHVEGGPSYWGNASDLSLGGCYVETPIPLDPGTKLSVAVWIEQSKVIVQGTVVHRTPGLGVGIRFHQLSSADHGIIRSFLDRVSPLFRKPLRNLTI